MKVFRSLLALAFTTAFLLIACDSPSEPEPNDHNADNVCNAEQCGQIDALKQECEEFLSTCLEHEDEDECVGGALLICRGET